MPHGGGMIASSDGSVVIQVGPGKFNLQNIGNGLTPQQEKDLSKKVIEMHTNRYKEEKLNGKKINIETEGITYFYD